MRKSSPSNSRNIKVCIITCYWVPDYVRASTLRSATKLALSDGDGEVIIIKNSRTNVLRYAEVIWKIFKTRIRQRPDIYLLTFRGYEMLLPTRILTMGKPLIYDEFINMEEWLLENGKIKEGSTSHKFVNFIYRNLVKLPNLIITDTKSHAKYSEKLSQLPMGRVVGVPVSTDEHIFKPFSKRNDNKSLSVFYYGSYMMPVHGLSFLLEAAEKLKNYNIRFTIIGGGAKQEEAIKKLQKNGAKIDYTMRVPYEDLAILVQKADVCLGGPFGGTLQSQFVITGKTYQFMSAGKPTIVGENAETKNKMFKNKKNCLIVEQANPEAIAEAVIWCLNNGDKLEAIGKASRQTYVKEMSIESTAEILRTKVYSRFFK